MLDVFLVGVEGCRSALDFSLAFPKKSGESWLHQQLHLTSHGEDFAFFAPYSHEEQSGRNKRCKDLNRERSDSLFSRRSQTFCFGSTISLHRQKGNPCPLVMTSIMTGLLH